MFSASNTVDYHQKIYNAMAQLGYPYVKDGVCNGVAQMWVQAVLCGETDKFKARLRLIFDDEKLISQIAAVKAKKGRELSAKDRDYIDLLAFFDGIQLYQNPRLYTNLFEKIPHYLNAAAISKLTLPIKLAKQRVVEIYSDNRLFNFAELQAYLEQLGNEIYLYNKNRAALTPHDQSVPELAVCLHSCTHKIVLRLDGNDEANLKWELADVNHYPPFKVTTKYVYSSVSILEALTEGLIAPVNISIYTTHDNALKEVVKSTLHKLKNCYRINSAAAHTLSLRGNHLLMLTAMRGDKKRFVRIAKKIDNVELRNYLLPAAETAMYHRQTEIVNMVINQYPDCLIDARVIQDYLSIAIINKQNNLIKIIYQYGAELNSPDKRFMLPLHLAIEVDNIEAVKELVALGANINQVNARGETPIILAIKHRHLSIIDYLAGLPNINFDILDYTGESALILAIKATSQTACAILLSQHANANGKNERGETPAIVASALGQLAILELLVEFGADLNAMDTDARCPIFIAVLKQHWEMASFILLHLTSLESFNHFSYHLTISYLSNIINSTVEMIASLSDSQKEKTWHQLKHHENALGLILKKHPKNEFSTFFKINKKTRKSYLQQLQTAAEESQENISQDRYARI